MVDHKKVDNYAFQYDACMDWFQQNSDGSSLRVKVGDFILIVRLNVSFFRLHGFSKKRFFSQKRSFSQSGL